MNALLSTLAFLAGILTTAVIGQLVQRFFAAPRVAAAISEISLSRTKHRRHKYMPVPDSLRLLLSEGSTENVSYEDPFMSEHDIDLSILELIETDRDLSDHKEALQSRLGGLNSHTVRDQVLSLARDQNLIRTCLNALITFTDQAPQIPAASKDSPVVFPLRTIATEKEGRKLEFVHLDLPGNPFPIVGSLNGRPEINAKTVALGYAMSCCDDKILRAVLDLGVKYCDVRLSQTSQLRQEFQRIKEDLKYLELQILISNLGTAPAFLSTSARIQIGKEQSQVNLTLIDDRPQEDPPNWRVVIKDRARRLSEWIPAKRNEINRYQSVVENMTLAPSQSLTVHFVSNDPVADSVVQAVNAMRTGYASSTLTLWQYLPRMHRFFPFWGRFTKQIRSAQKSVLHEL